MPGCEKVDVSVERLALLRLTIDRSLDDWQLAMARKFAEVVVPDTQVRLSLAYQDGFTS